MTQDLGGSSWSKYNLKGEIREAVKYYSVDFSAKGVPSPPPPSPPPNPLYGKSQFIMKSHPTCAYGRHAFPVLLFSSAITVIIKINLSASSQS